MLHRLNIYTEKKHVIPESLFTSQISEVQFVSRQGARAVVAKEASLS